MLNPLTPIKGNPVQGGAVTVRNAAQLPFGSYSMVQNIRGKHPNFIKRPGQRKLHSTADGSNEVLSLYQFRKSRVDEKHFYAQMSDGDILEATNDPPIVTSGVFGSEVFDGSINQIPASWSNHGDKLIMSNGVDQHQIYGGTGSYIERFVVYTGDGVVPNIPKLGTDFSEVVRNDRDGVATLSDLPTLALYGCVFICVPMPVTGFGFVISSANTTVCTTAIQYYHSSTGWTAVSGLDDGTASGGIPLSQNGSMTFTAPSVADSENAGLIPRYQFGRSGFWYRVHFSDALSGAVTIKSVTFQSDFQNIVNVWDGVYIPAIECQVYDSYNERWLTYGSGSVEHPTAATRLMVASADPIEGIYIDVGSTPNALAANITYIKYFNGTEFVNVSEYNDGTIPVEKSGSFGRSGWITFSRENAQPHQFLDTQHFAYWYEVDYDSISGGPYEISTMPYFDISELGISQCSTIWKDRAVYSFDEYGAYLYISKAGYPLVLNGSDYGILRAGDGRNNKIVNMKSYKDVLITFQEEKGVEGGCVTLFTGSTLTNISRTVLSSRIGTMNAKSVEVVESVETATADKATALEEKIATLVFFLSVKGVCVSNSYTISIISDDIQNYFDPTKPESIRRGYEDKMLLKYDSAHGVLRLGLVTGSLATKPNVFPVYDLKDKTWSFDVLGQNLSCLTECEAGSGNIPTLQIAGGQEDGTVYQLNYGLNDVNEAVDSYAQMELNLNGEIINL